jgi:Nucleotidyl transferase AbiEii toxin, Type IV TA system
MESTMRLDRDFREFVESFVAHEVRFLLVGGYALAAHGLPRATGDFDAWVWIDPSNASRIVAALRAFGFGSLGIREGDFTAPDLVVQLGYPPHRIDILTSIDGVEFEDAWDRRVSIDVDGLPIPVISRDDLLANKLAAGRPQDLADVDRLRSTDE